MPGILPRAHIPAKRRYQVSRKTDYKKALNASRNSMIDKVFDRTLEEATNDSVCSLACYPLSTVHS